MNTPNSVFVREVARIDDPEFVSGQAAGHRARRLIDAPDAAFADPFVLMAEDWTSEGAFAFHPHCGIETVTFVIKGAIEIGSAADPLEASQLGWLMRSETSGSSELTIRAQGTVGRF
ncbi:hypothetical protein [Bordetella sp. FB-8]|uniref:hypothetical protein n=1 Tax=Bordetella sp. FB-8 TaxID=1159870 RepID=UPI000381135B|nr:hypothetical protein [Bordetella sp. FB-8]